LQSGYSRTGEDHATAKRSLLNSHEAAQVSEFRRQNNPQSRIDQPSDTWDQDDQITENHINKSHSELLEDYGFASSKLVHRDLKVEEQDVMFMNPAYYQRQPGYERGAKPLLV
jgi:hypothetical protein